MVPKSSDVPAAVAELARTDLDLAIALWTLERLRPEELTEIAAEALKTMNTKSLRQLAGYPATEHAWILLQEFERALWELGRPLPSRAEAARLIAVHVARLLVEGRVTPYPAARYLMETSWCVPDDHSDDQFDDLDAFVSAASEYDDNPSLRDALDIEIREEALRWVGRDNGRHRGKPPNEAL